MVVFFPLLPGVSGMIWIVNLIPQSCNRRKALTDCWCLSIFYHQALRLPPQSLSVQSVFLTVNVTLYVWEASGCIAYVTNQAFYPRGSPSETTRKQGRLRLIAYSGQDSLERHTHSYTLELFSACLSGLSLKAVLRLSLQTQREGS